MSTNIVAPCDAHCIGSKVNGFDRCAKVLASRSNAGDPQPAIAGPALDDLVLAASTSLQVVQTRQGRRGDRGQRLACEERLMSCDQDVRKGEESGEHVVAEHLIRAVRKKQVRLLL